MGKFALFMEFKTCVQNANLENICETFC